MWFVVVPVYEIADIQFENSICRRFIQPLSCLQLLVQKYPPQSMLNPLAGVSALAKSSPSPVILSMAFRNTSKTHLLLALKWQNGTLMSFLTVPVSNDHLKIKCPLEGYVMNIFSSLIRSVVSLTSSSDKYMAARNGENSEFHHGVWLWSRLQIPWWHWQNISSLFERPQVVTQYSRMPA